MKLLTLIFALVSFSSCATFSLGGEDEYGVLINEEGGRNTTINVQDRPLESIQQCNDSQSDYVNLGNYKFNKSVLTVLSFIFLLFLAMAAIYIFGIIKRNRSISH